MCQYLVFTTLFLKLSYFLSSDIGVLPAIANHKLVWNALAGCFAALGTVFVEEIRDTVDLRALSASPVVSIECVI